MKPLIVLPRSPSPPLVQALVLTLAFLPSVLNLALTNFPVLHPGAALGPIVAGFWLAAQMGPIRINFAILGTLMSSILWVTNLLMAAGDHCCLTMPNPGR